MLDQFTYDVFLSHSAKDKAVVRAVAERLRKDGLKVWFDEWVLKAGDSLSSGERARVRASQIEEGREPAEFGTRNSELGIPSLRMSANAFGSDWAQLQTNSQLSTFNSQPTTAPLNKERRFIPLRLDDAPIKGSLAQFFYIKWPRTDGGIPNLQ